MLLHLGDRSRGRAVLGPAMNQGHAPRFGQELERPVERRTAATENDQVLAVKPARILHSIVQGGAFEDLRALDADATWLERADTRRNDHRTRVERRTRRRPDMEAAALLARELDDFLPEMKGRVERLDLLHEPVHELLRPTYR